ncbi:esterase/lipase family protein [Azohydromonas aeria]|uniref:esterase/lipase family protein n=1 Tax=Azohydromonas aeria TaxID=2590212 RepID=UPI0012FB9F2D|nr:alpha/beta fold hydrolase [Azohydromonas aeria]
MRRVLLPLLLLASSWGAPVHAAAAAPALDVALLDAAGAPVQALVDGNSVRLRAQLDRAAPRPVAVTFRLDGRALPAGCTVPRAARGCTTAPLSTLNWYWDAQADTAGAAATARPNRTLSAEATPGRASALTLRADTAVALRPRPVVLVHGFLSDHQTWAAYTGPGGFLAQAGLRGFAVGDGQAEGAMDTGALARLRSATKSLPENAAALQRYVEGVRRLTGAQQVDLLAHSMGGLVSRYYVARLMRDRAVAQLIMLGSPHGGSDCSGLASALGVLEPAALELSPAFVRQVFNPGVTRRHGVPFHMLAGDPIAEAFRAPCSGVPSDGVVSVGSASAIPGPVRRLPVLHTDMTASAEVAAGFVLPLLRQGALQDTAGWSESAGDAVSEPDTQYAQVAAGHVEAGASVEVAVELDDVAVAAFALFDPSRALETTVRGASGRVIELTAREHGLVRVEDPSSLLTLGYGFERPRPGPWRVTLHAPREASDFALSARVSGGAVLHAAASPLTPARGQAVQLSAALEHPSRALEGVALRAVVHRPDGSTEALALPGEGARRSVAWRAARRGLHGIELIASARAGELRIERRRFLVVEVGP